MKKIQKIQIISSIIPFYSSVFVFIVTMIELKKKKASLKSWVLFLMIFFLSGVSVYILNTMLMTGLHPALNVLASGLLLSIANILCVDLQVKSRSKKDVSKQILPRKTTILICAGAGVFLLGTVITFVLFSSSHIDIADTNGEQDTRLAVLTRDNLLSASDEYSAFRIRYSFSGSETNVGRKLEEVDRDTCTYSFKKISGTKTLQATKADCDKLTLEITSTLAAGNAEIVVLIDGSYYTHAALNKTNTIVLEQISDKMVLVRLGAESAEISVSVTRTPN